MEIYKPDEDSYLLQEILINYLKESISNDYLVKAEKYNNQQKPHHNNLKVNNIMNLNKKIKILDMGSGSGIQAKTAIKLGFKNTLAIDLNPDTIKYLKKQKIKTIKSNLFEELKKRKNKYKFDLIIFNPPYLPENKYDKEIDTTGGKKGHETIIKFLKQAKKYLNKEGKIILLFSSLSHPSIIKKQAKKLDYSYKLLGKKHISFEKLYVYELSKT